MEPVEITKSNKLGFQTTARWVINSQGTLSSGFVFLLCEAEFVLVEKQSINFVSSSSSSATELGHVTPQVLPKAALLFCKVAKATPAAYDIM